MSSDGDESPPSGHLHRRRTDPADEGQAAMARVQASGYEPPHPDERTPHYSHLHAPLYAPSPMGHLHQRKDDPSAKKHAGKKDDLKSDAEEAKTKDGKDADDKEANTKDGDKKKKMSPRKKRLLIIVAVIVGILVIAAGILYWLHARHFEKTDDAFIDGHISQVSARVSGQVSTLLIRDNQHVEAGQLLFTIDPRDFAQSLAQAQAKRAQAVAQVALEAANIQQGQANAEAAQADDFQATQDLKRYRSVNPKAVARQQLDAAIANAAKAHAKWVAAKKAVEAAKAQRKAAESAVEEADAEIGNATLQLSYTKILAPITGHIARRSVEIGNVVQAGTPLLAVVSDDLWVTANYKETQLTLMRLNQPVRIKVDAYPDAVFKGHVDSFQRGTGSQFSTLPAENATGNYVKVVQRVPVKIVFDNPDQRDRFPLSPGMSVDPRVTVR